MGRKKYYIAMYFARKDDEIPLADILIEARSDREAGRKALRYAREKVKDACMLILAPEGGGRIIKIIFGCESP